MVYLRAQKNRNPFDYWVSVGIGKTLFIKSNHTRFHHFSGANAFNKVISLFEISIVIKSIHFKTIQNGYKSYIRGCFSNIYNGKGL